MEALKLKIKQSGIKKRMIAELLNISPQSLSNKLGGRCQFSVNEAVTLCDVLGIDYKDFGLFFAQELEKS